MNPAHTIPAQPEARALLHKLLGDRCLDLLNNGLEGIAACKQLLDVTQAVLDARFVEGVDVGKLIRGRAALIDGLIQRLWEQQGWDNKQKICIVAVGGYGRGELHPHSDIDLLFLHNKKLNANNREVLEK